MDVCRKQCLQDFALDRCLESREAAFEAIVDLRPVVDRPQADPAAAPGRVLGQSDRALRRSLGHQGVPIIP